MKKIAPVVLSLIPLISFAAPPPEMDRYARQLGTLCGFDMRADDAVRHIQKQPAFFWLAGQAASQKDGMTPTDFHAIRAAVTCNGSEGVVVNQEAAAKLIDESRAVQQQESRKGKS